MGPPLPEVRIPRVVGLREEEGLRILREAGLDPEPRAEVEVDVPPGTILRTDPGEDLLVRIGRKIRVDVASLAPDVAVPELIGRQIEEVEAELARLGLMCNIREAPADSSGTIPGTILLQDPAPGTSLPARSRIDLVVAAFPEDTRVMVPNLQGSAYDAAESALVAAGLGVGEVRSLSVSAPPGTVYATDPPMGRRVPRGTHVNLTIAGSIPTPAPVARRISLSYTVPDSGPNGNYQIFLSDGGEEREVWHGKAKPGAVVATEVEVRGSSPSFRVVCGGKVIDAWRL